MEPWRLAADAVAALATARHADPFAVLGPHDAPGGTVIRAVLPGAETAEARPDDGGPPIRLDRRDAAGVFEGFAPGRAPGFGYRLHARRGADAWSLRDAYAFGPTLGPLDDHLFMEGTHLGLQDRLGAHPCVHEGVPGVRFAVWAPHARRVSVVGEWNGWDGRAQPMRKRVDSGVWEIFVPDLGPGDRYKYEIVGADDVVLPLKADPFAQAAELRPATASIVTAGLPLPPRAAAPARPARKSPLSIYEVHLGSWRRGPAGRFLTWDELAETLVPYVADLGFTHLELLPITEHPFDGSWGYQATGMFAPTSRFGDPAGCARFIAAAHAAGLGVLLDWVPAHFPADEFALARFDGTALYEHPDPRRGSHPEWGTLIYDWGRREVSNMLIASALHWLARLDGLRVDAVASMLYLNYARKDGEWAPNPDGSNHNTDAVAFIKRLNATIAEAYPHALIMAEESTAWAGVTRPVAEGGLGFGFKWNLGWMHDTLDYFSREPVHRPHHHNELTFGLLYAWNEAFVLPLSHDEVVHGKSSLIGRMPGDDWQRFAGLRSLFGWMWGHPGKKLLFMGGEFAQRREWDEAGELQWDLLAYAPHQGMQALVRDLNRLHRTLPALHAKDHDPEGFRWIVVEDRAQSVFAWARFGDAEDPPVVVICNLTPVPREAYRVGLPRPGRWREVLNSDAAAYGGSGLGNLGRVFAQPIESHGFPASAECMLPPLSSVFLLWEGA